LKACVGRRHAGINGSLKEQFFEIARLQFVLQPRPQVHRKLLPSTKRSHGCKSKQSSRPHIQFRTCPDGSPRVARDQVLKFAIEGVGCGNGSIHVFVAQRCAAHGKSCFGTLSFIQLGQQKFEQRCKE
jgi:hypothetical protein